MKRILTSILMAVGITGPFAPQLAAQQNRMVADVPFTFVVNNRSMPAGHYSLSQEEVSRSTFAIRDALGKTVFTQLGSIEEGKPNNPSLTFACYAGHCALAKVTPPNSLTAYSVGRASIEKSLHHAIRVAAMVSVKLSPAVGPRPSERRR